MERRSFLKTGAAGLLGAGLARPLDARSAENSGGTKWRTFEVTTRLEIVSGSGRLDNISDGGGDLSLCAWKATQGDVGRRAGAAGELRDTAG